jgi:hypothetical protein
VTAAPPARTAGATAAPARGLRARREKRLIRMFASMP